MGSERESRGRMSRTGPRRVPQHLSYRWTHWGAQRSQDSVRIMKPIMAWVSLESRNFLGMSGRRWHRNWKRFYPSRYPQAASPLTTSRVMVADQLLPSRATVLHLRLPTDQRCSTAPQAGRQGAAQSRELLAAGFHPRQEMGCQRGRSPILPKTAVTVPTVSPSHAQFGFPALWDQPSTFRFFSFALWRGNHPPQSVQ